MISNEKFEVEIKMTVYQVIDLQLNKQDAQHVCFNFRLAYGQNSIYPLRSGNPPDISQELKDIKQ